MQPAGSNYLKGAAFGFAAVSIWASWSVVTRLGGYDQPGCTGHRGVALRCRGSPPVAGRHATRPCQRPPWMAWTGRAHCRARRALCAGGGELVCTLRPACDQGALNPGCMPLFVALIAATVVGERLSTMRNLGLSLILAGAAIIVGWHAEGRGTAWSLSRTLGDALFLIAAFLTACFTVAMRQAKARSVARRSARLPSGRW